MTKRDQKPLADYDDHIEAEVTYLILVEMMKEAWDEVRARKDQPKALT